LASHPQPEEDMRQSTPENRYYSKEELEWKKQARKEEINKRKCCCAVL
uniref:Ezrin n=1 Tax=Steinernema glaseri TaxID=37863 RepID=A0A1I8ABB1_9BILA